MIHRIRAMFADFRKHQMNWPAFAGILVGLLVLFTFGMFTVSGDMQKAQNLKQDLTDRQQDLTEKNLETEQAIQHLYSDSNVEDSARELFGMVWPGEIRFQIENSELLRNYTKEETQILAEELAEDDRNRAAEREPS